jgi:hypothetical protein
VAVAFVLQVVGIGLDDLFLRSAIFAAFICAAVQVGQIYCRIVRWIAFTKSSLIWGIRQEAHWRYISR